MKEEQVITSIQCPTRLATIYHLSPLKSFHWKQQLSMELELQKYDTYNVLCLPVSLGFFHAAVSLAQTVDIQKGASLFRQACIGCHDGGGNVIQPVSCLIVKSR